MSWPLFAVIQLAFVTIGVTVAFWLRNGELKKRFEGLQDATAEASEAVEQARRRLEDVSRGAERVWLAERIEALSGDDEQVTLQRLVLENELEASDDFSERLAALLNAGEGARQGLQERWQALRTAAHELASDLIERYPRSHPIIVQLHSAFDELDQELDVSPGPLPDAPEVDAANETDLAQEVEHLRASNELLEKQLEEARNQMAETTASGEDAEEQAEDLKALLQQFTRDSRDMMACIQRLETENKELRDRLGVDTPDATNADETTDADNDSNVDPASDEAEDAA